MVGSQGRQCRRGGHRADTYPWLREASLMCGIAGFVDPHGGLPALELEAVARSMAASLAHRGPDDAGVWTEQESGVALAHRRLAILDPSPAGHQPMVSAGRRYVIVFNGEIYNFSELRAELEHLGAAPAWRGRSDTETLLAAFEHWGVTAALKRCAGMFAFALFDTRKKVLYLARDRIGEKPLYFGLSGGVLLFGSELSALRTHPAWCAQVDRNAITLLLRHGYIPQPYSIYCGIGKLKPGTCLELPLARMASGELPAPVAYWSLSEVISRGSAEPFSGTTAAATAMLDRLLREAVAGQMVADVPVGAFLSGGVDSSTVVALMQAQSSRAVKTFTIGFHERGYDEAVDARALARQLGTDHTELYVTPAEAMAVVPRLPSLYDEPFADSSQIPTFLIAQLARQEVTVSLSGDGGDESFGGYSRYASAHRLWGRVGRVPAPLRRLGAQSIRRTPAAVLDSPLLAWLDPLLRRHARAGRTSDKLRKAADIVSLPDERAFYRGMTSHWKTPAEIVRGADEPMTVLTDPGTSFEDRDFRERMMAWDTLGYLPDDILAKVDRAAMGVSLETRMPLLDHRVIEFAWRLPLDFRIREGAGKWLLRQVLHHYVPKALVERPKMGFGVPIGEWLRGALRDWAESLIGATRLNREGFFRPLPVRDAWAEHLAGTRDWGAYLWDVLMFQAWLESQRSPVHPARESAARATTHV